MTLEELAEAWQAGIEQAAYTYAHKHPELYRRMLIGATANYRGQPGAAKKAVAVVDHAAAMAAGYPSWPTYLLAHEAAA